VCPGQNSSVDAPNADAFGFIRMALRLQVTAYGDMAGQPTESVSMLAMVGDGLG